MSAYSTTAARSCATALVNRSLQPGVLFMAETTYTRYYKEGFLQNVTNSARLERGYCDVLRSADPL